jgi:predicted enzyme related to lactoylglutathione lyase
MSHHGRILWTELNTHDSATAKAFYGAAFGWTFDAMPMADGGTYWIAKIPGDEKAIVGVFEMKGDQFVGMPDHWFTYFGLDDIDASLAKVPGLGGQIIRPAWDIPGVGRIAVVRGASGAGEGWMQPAPGMA